MNKELHIAIKQIKELSFSINNDVDIEYVNANKSPSLDYEQELKFNDEDLSIDITLSFAFYEKTKDNVITFLSIKTINSFYIHELKSFKGDEEYNLPEILIPTILGLSISHTRALLSKNTIGSKYSNIFIPILNPTKLAEEFKKS